MKNNFTYGDYIKLVRSIKRQGYAITTFRDHHKYRKFSILRHDVDYSLEKALRMARLEAEHTIKATYFVLISSPYYNLFSLKNRSFVSQISKLGHEIGLHYDQSALENISHHKRKNEIRHTINLLESCLGIKIKSIAEHKPAETRLKLNLPGFHNAYAPEFTRDIHFVRDSAMNFDLKNLDTIFHLGVNFQLLIHPIWWQIKRQTLSEVFDQVKIACDSEIRTFLRSDLTSIGEWHRRQKTSKYLPWKKPQYKPIQKT